MYEICDRTISAWYKITWLVNSFGVVEEEAPSTRAVLRNSGATVGSNGVCGRENPFGSLDQSVVGGGANPLSLKIRKMQKQIKNKSN